MGWPDRSAFAQGWRDAGLAWRLLEREWAHAGVAVAGLALGLAVAFLLLGFVEQSLNFDQHIPDPNHTFLVRNELNVTSASGKRHSGSALTVKGDIERSYPGLLATRYVPLPQDMAGPAHTLEVALCAVDPSFQDIMGVQVLEGDLGATLRQRHQLALTRTSALRLFGGVHVIGQTLQLGGRPFQVGAVVADPPGSTTLPFGALSSLDTVLWSDLERTAALDDWWAGKGKLLLRLGAGASVTAVTQRLQELADASTMFNQLSPEQMEQLGNQKLMQMRLLPLREAYFLDADGGVNRGERATLVALELLAGLIVLIAAGNYFNLYATRLQLRRREIALRRLLGASTARIASQFLTESTLLALLATVGGLAGAWLLSPWFEQLAHRPLDPLLTPWAVLRAGLLGMGAGLAASAYPVWTALSTRPHSALAGRLAPVGRSSLRLRRALCMVQLACAMAIIALTVTAFWQTARMTAAGADGDALLYFNLPQQADRTASTALLHTLARQSAVAAVTTVSGAAGGSDARLHIVLQWQAHNPVPMALLEVSADFFEVQRTVPLAGRLFAAGRDDDDGEALVLNAAAASALGMDSAPQAIGQQLRQTNRSARYKVVGVVPHLRHPGSQASAQPLAYRIGQRGTLIGLRARPGQLAAAERAVQAQWGRSFPADVPHLYRLGNMLEQQYADEIRLSRLLFAGSMMALAITAFGIYGLTAFTVQRRSAEIAIRKLHGARAIDICLFLGRELGTTLLLGIAAGLPLGYFATRRYLSVLTEMTEIGAWHLLLAAAACTLIVILAAIRHLVLAMRQRPLLVLR